jgi:hypothetical protein
MRLSASRRRLEQRSAAHPVSEEAVQLLEEEVGPLSVEAAVAQLSEEEVTAQLL